MPSPLKKILITGAGGMLGTDLAEAFSPSFEVLGAGRKPAPHLPISFISQDLTASHACTKIVANFKPELIFHCAAMTDVDGCELNPEEAFRVVGEWAPERSNQFL